MIFFIKREFFGGLLEKIEFSFLFLKKIREKNFFIQVSFEEIQLNQINL